MGKWYRSSDYEKYILFKYGKSTLTWFHRHDIMMFDMCVSNLSTRQSLVQITVCRLKAPGRYLNQWWYIVSSAIGNTLRWKLNRNTTIFIQENELENVAWKMSTILSRRQSDTCVGGKWRWEKDTPVWKPLSYVPFYTNIHLYVFILNSYQSFA